MKLAVFVPGCQDRRAEVVHGEERARLREITRKSNQLRMILKEGLGFPCGLLRAYVGDWSASGIERPRPRFVPSSS